MDRLIDDLLDLASIDAGRLSIERTRHDPCAVAGEAVDSMAALAQERGVALLLDACLGLPPVRCDRDRVVQVLVNLLGNTLKVTPPGGSVVVSVEAASGEMTFKVSDTGPGVPPDELPHLFQRYWRGSTAQYKGTGLGLTIAKGLVEAHGGRIWAEGRPGGGSVFAFALGSEPEVEPARHTC
jgi:signal transduction histidine kinase